MPALYTDQGLSKTVLTVFMKKKKIFFFSTLGEILQRKAGNEFFRVAMPFLDDGKRSAIRQSKSVVFKEACSRSTSHIC